MSSGDPRITRVVTDFEILSTVASSLNTASDELTKVVGILDESLRKLSIGLTVWVTFRFRGGDNPQTEYDEDQIGYAKVQGTWGVALRRIWGDEARDIYNEDGPWIFNDAPRELRIGGVDKIPDVIEALAKMATATTKKVQEKANQVSELAAAINQIANSPKSAKDFRPWQTSNAVENSTRLTCSPKFSPGKT